MNNPWVYKQTEPGLWTVGYYEAGKWEPESDHDDKEKAASRVAWLNGGGSTPPRFTHDYTAVVHLRSTDNIDEVGTLLSAILDAHGLSESKWTMIHGEPERLAPAIGIDRHACTAYDEVLAELARYSIDHEESNTEEGAETNQGFTFTFTLEGVIALWAGRRNFAASKQDVDDLAEAIRRIPALSAAPLLEALELMIEAASETAPTARAMRIDKAVQQARVVAARARKAQSDG